MIKCNNRQEMKFKQSQLKKEGINDSKLFFKGLQQKYTCFKTNFKNTFKQISINQQIIKSQNNHNKLIKPKKKQICQNKPKSYKFLIDLTKCSNQQFLSNIHQQYNFDTYIKTNEQLSKYINELIQNNQPKFICIKIIPISNTNTKTKTQFISNYIQSIITHFQKSTICIYSIGYQLEKVQFYDMLSIRRQLKIDTKLLVQTNICNNSKSGIIIRKLIDVAKQRQKTMNLQNLINVVVVKIKGVLHLDKYPGESKQIQLQISAGGYGQIGMKDLMDVQKLRVYIQVIQCEQQNTIQQIQNAIIKYKKPCRVQNQNELIKKIRYLQVELAEKRKQLEEQKIKKAKQQELQVQIQEIVLPSERPMIDVQKFSTKIPNTVLRQRKHSFL